MRVIEAKRIMPANFFGYNEAVRWFGVTGLAFADAAGKFPYSARKIEACRDTHLLVLFSGQPLVVTRDQSRWHAHRLYSQHRWWLTEPFASRNDKVGWYLIPRTAGSDANFSAAVLGYAIVGHYLETGERLFNNGVLCTDTTASGKGVMLGFDKRGLRVEKVSKHSRGNATV